MSSFFQQLIKHDMIYIKARISNESGFVWFGRLRGVRSVENEECGKCGVCIFVERVFYNIVTIAYK